MKRVLICEDEDTIREFVVINLKRAGYDVVDVNCGEDALKTFDAEHGNFDVVLLDIMMPGIDGFELCRIIRKRSDVPVVFLTGKVREEDVLYGYELGADDYIVKPFSIKVLYSKLLAILERTDTDRVTHKVLESGQIMLDPSKFEVTVGGEIIDLPPKEYLILKYMMEHPGTAITRRLLLAACWNDDSFITERVIDNRVKNLRKKLGKEGTRIKTLIGVGYRFD
jgi:DNA-binding response OmpR family regulator